jgi:hypothetical protein
MDNARQQAKELHEDAMESIAPLDERADTLRDISSYIIERIR